MKIGFEYKVKETFASMTKRELDDILICSNIEKYYDKVSPNSGTDYSDRVCRLMKELNKTGISDNSLGVLIHGDSFNVALSKTVNDIAELSADKVLSYIELGPEPIKTSFIIEKLIDYGIKIDSYTAVDINPSSSSIMHKTISKFLPPEKINFIVSSYENCNKCSFPKEGSISLFTTLGFQEGNEDPFEFANILNRITEPSDLILSELQLISNYTTSSIFDFYNDYRMKNFSKIVLKQHIGNLESTYGIFLLPITLGNTTSFIAVTTETILSIGDLYGKTFITNFCLKHTLEDFNNLREADTNFKVKSVRLTEDQSIGFQLSQRR